MPFSLSNFRYLPRSLANGAQNLYNSNTVNPREQSAEKGNEIWLLFCKESRKKMSLFSSDIGIDLGTATVLVYVKGKGVVLNEPSVVAVDKVSGKILAVGEEAQSMLGRTPGNIVAIRPLREGVISDYEMTERMIKEFIAKVQGIHLFKPNVVICVPSIITEVEERAVIDAGTQAGAKRVFFWSRSRSRRPSARASISTEPTAIWWSILAAARPMWRLFRSAASSNPRPSRSRAISSTRPLSRYVRRKHNALIGDRTAEEIKRTVGCVYPRSEEAIMEVRGRCLMTGLPRTFTVSSSEILDALEEVSSAIVEAVHWVLERTPPELTGDISANGITMTGGGSLIWGFDKLIASKTGIPTRVADEAVSCVAYGTGNCLENLSKMQDGTMNLSRQRQMKAR